MTHLRIYIACLAVEIIRREGSICCHLCGRYEGD